MILVDTSIWVEHFRVGHPVLRRLLERGVVLGHPWVTGELALGHLAHRQEVLGLLGALPPATVVTDSEILAFIVRNDLGGTGIGYVDVHLLAATRLTPHTTLWTADRRLAVGAAQLGVAVDQRELDS